MQNNRQSRRTFLKNMGVTLAVAMATGSTSFAAKAKKPNFVMIFTDDQGYQDIGCFGSPLIKTPNLDKMANEGTRFTDFYSANSVCTPSRASLLTGCYPTRVSIYNVIFPYADRGLHPKEITVADMLKTKGYATACIGKWHLGHEPEFLPTRQGFDYYYGIPYSNDMHVNPKMKLADNVKLLEGVTAESFKKDKPKQNWVPLMENEEVVEYPCDQRTLTKRYTEKGLKFIEDNKDRPFFLYVPYTMPHIPLFASDEFKDTSARGLYGDVIEEIDAGVGKILKKLKALGLDDNTMVIFTSDNGPWLQMKENGGCALPLRGGKFQTYEGGMRVPCIMRWPGRIPAKKVCDQLCSTIDIMPTFAKLANCDMPTDRIIDGENIWPLISGKVNKSPRDDFYYYSAKRLEAVRSGQWKLRKVGEDIELYDLKNDISEKNNLAEKKPELVAKLLAKMQAFDKELNENKRPVGRVKK